MKYFTELFDLIKRYIRASIRARKFKKLNRKMFKRLKEKIKERKEVVNV